MRQGRFSGLSSAERAASEAAGRRRLVAAALIPASPGVVAAAALFRPGPIEMAVAAALGLLLASIGLFLLRGDRGGDAVAAAITDSDRARRLIADFEESGSGWFWETNADGLLTYVSEPLARTLGRDASNLSGP